MGGDALNKKTKPVQAKDYYLIVQQILKRIHPVFVQQVKLLPSMPQKQQHGDIDFIVLGDKSQAKQISQRLQSTQTVKNGKMISMDFMQHQVDFSFVQNRKQLDLQIFYNSYGGLGSVIGRILKHHSLKLSASGLYYKQIQKSKKVQVLLSDDWKVILEFMGLNWKPLVQGFAKLIQLLQYLGKMKFWNSWKSKEQKHQIKYGKHKPTKLMNKMDQFVQQKGLRNHIVQQDVSQLAIDFFNKEKQVKQAKQKIFPK